MPDSSVTDSSEKDSNDYDDGVDSKLVGGKEKILLLAVVAIQVTECTSNSTPC